MPTIKDIAKVCGVSFQTVSYVLNGKPGKVSAETREKITRTARTMGYTPNLAARGIVKGRTFLIGLLFPAVNDHFYPELVFRIQYELQKRNYNGICGFWENDAGAAEAFKSIARHKVDGIICAHSDPALLPGNIPAVNYSRTMPGADAVRFPKQETICAAYEYLYSLGHRKIALFSAENSVLSEEILHLFPDPGMIRCGSGTFSGGCQMMAELLGEKERPTAVIAHNDITAIGAMTTALKNGLSVPEDISIIGRDDIEEARYAPVPLTTFSVKGEPLHEVLVRMLCERIEHPELPERDVLLPWQFSIRDSVSYLSSNGGEK